MSVPVFEPPDPAERYTVYVLRDNNMKRRYSAWEALQLIQMGYKVRRDQYFQHDYVYVIESPSESENENPVKEDEPGEIRPEYLGPMEPRYPCREIPTRHCPAALGSQCPAGPCARYDLTDDSVWLPEIGAGRYGEPEPEWHKGCTWCWRRIWHLIRETSISNSNNCPHQYTQEIDLIQGDMYGCKVVRCYDCGREIDSHRRIYGCPLG
jgi:hypothetical protein